MSVSEKKKYARITFKSTSLWRVLEKLREHYKSEHKPKTLVVPYVLTCATYLESKLNDSLLEFSIERYGDDMTTALMRLTLTNKLNVIVPILTDGRYRINKEHFVYQRLVSLIRVRNSISHAKSEIEELEAGSEDLIKSIVHPLAIIQIPRQFINEPDITLGASKAFTPLQYHDALDKLEKWFFGRYPDRLSKVEMVIDRSNEGKWEQTTKTLVKYFDE